MCDHAGKSTGTMRYLQERELLVPMTYCEGCHTVLETGEPIPYRPAPVWNEERPRGEAEL